MHSVHGFVCSAGLRLAGEGRVAGREGYGPGRADRSASGWGAVATRRARGAYEFRGSGGRGGGGWGGRVAGHGRRQGWLRCWGWACLFLPIRGGGLGVRCTGLVYLGAGVRCWQEGGLRGDTVGVAAGGVGGGGVRSIIMADGQRRNDSAGGPPVDEGMLSFPLVATTAVGQKRRGRKKGAGDCVDCRRMYVRRGCRAYCPD